MMICLDRHIRLLLHRLPHRLLIHHRLRRSDCPRPLRLQLLEYLHREIGFLLRRKLPAKLRAHHLPRLRHLGLARYLR